MTGASRSRTSAEGVCLSNPMVILEERAAPPPPTCNSTQPAPCPALRRASPGMCSRAPPVLHRLQKPRRPPPQQLLPLSVLPKCVRTMQNRIPVLKTQDNYTNTVTSHVPTGSPPSCTDSPDSAVTEKESSHCPRIINQSRSFGVGLF